MVLPWVAVHAQINKPIQEISHTFTYGVVGKIFSLYIHSCKIFHIFHYFDENLSSHLVGCGKQNLRLFQVSPCFPRWPWVPGHLWDAKASVGSTWSSGSCSIYAGIHRHVCHPIWSLVVSWCVSPLPLPCSCYKGSSGVSYIPTTLSPLGGWGTSLYCSHLYWGLRIVWSLFVRTELAT